MTIWRVLDLYFAGIIIIRVRGYDLNWGPTIKCIMCFFLIMTIFMGETRHPCILAGCEGRRNSLRALWGKMGVNQKMLE